MKDEERLIPNKSILKKEKMKEKPGPKNEHRYSDRQKTKAFEFYCSTDGSVSKVSERTGIPIPTIKDWRRKYKWDKIIEESAVKAAVDIHANSEKLNKTLETISEEKAYKELGIVKESNNYPDILSKSTAVSKSESYKNLLSQIAEIRIIEEEYQTLKEIDHIVKSSLMEQKLKPQNWSDVMNGLNFITKRYDKLTEKLLKIKELAGDTDKSEMAELYDENNNLIKASNEFFTGELGDYEEEEILEEEEYEYPEDDDEEED